MGDIQAIKDPAPFAADLSSGTVTIGVDGRATVTGAGTLRTKKFVVRGMRSVSLFVQGTGTGVGAAAAGTPATAWKVYAANDYDPTRPAQKPGTWTDVTALFGATAGAATPPGTKQFNGAAFTGAISDSFATPECPFDAIYFEYTNASGNETVAGQFLASEI